jgi:hypothetical protein
VFKDFSLVTWTKANMVSRVQQLDSAFHSQMQFERDHRSGIIHVLLGNIVLGGSVFGLRALLTAVTFDAEFGKLIFEDRVHP